MNHPSLTVSRVYQHRSRLRVLSLSLILAACCLAPAMAGADRQREAKESRQAGVTGNVHTLSNAYKQLVGVTSETPQYEGWASEFYLPGLDSTVRALVLDSNGHLYAGGSFTKAGGVNARMIAKWDGESWSALGSGMGGVYSTGVYALAVDQAGNLYAGCDFTTAGGVSVNYVARWDGTSWSLLGAGIGGDHYAVHALAIDSNNVYAAANYDWYGTCHTVLAKWDGTRWSGIDNGNGVVDEIFALAADRSSSVFAGGDLHTADGLRVDHIARWSGSSWSALSNGTNARVYAIAVDQASAAV